MGEDYDFDGTDESVDDLERRARPIPETRTFTYDWQSLRTDGRRDGEGWLRWKLRIWKLRRAGKRLAKRIDRALDQDD